MTSGRFHYQIPDTATDISLHRYTRHKHTFTEVNMNVIQNVHLLVHDTHTHTHLMLSHLSICCKITREEYLFEGKQISHDNIYLMKPLILNPLSTCRNIETRGYLHVRKQLWHHRSHVATFIHQFIYYSCIRKWKQEFPHQQQTSDFDISVPSIDT